MENNLDLWSKVEHFSSRCMSMEILTRAHHNIHKNPRISLVFNSEIPNRKFKWPPA